MEDDWEVVLPLTVDAYDCEVSKELTSLVAMTRQRQRG